MSRGELFLIGILVIFTVAVVAVAVLGIIHDDTVAASQKPYQVDWVEINPPPGAEGPCWAFYDGIKGYNGVWCE